MDIVLSESLCCFYLELNLLISLELVQCQFQSSLFGMFCLLGLWLLQFSVWNCRSDLWQVKTCCRTQNPEAAPPPLLHKELFTCLCCSPSSMKLDSVRRTLNWRIRQTMLLTLMRPTSCCCNRKLVACLFKVYSLNSLRVQIIQNLTLHLLYP